MKILGIGVNAVVRRGTEMLKVKTVCRNKRGETVVAEGSSGLVLLKEGSYVLEKIPYSGECYDTNGNLVE